MQNTVKKTVLACIAGLLITIGLSFGQSEKVQAYGNDQIYGLVFWGTSGVSRMYNDLGDENYENTEDSSHRGTEEQKQHLWASHVGTDYGYLNYADFTNMNYWVYDAKNYAEVGNVSSGQEDLADVLPRLNSQESQNLKFGYVANSDASWTECKTAVVIWTGEDWVVRNSTGSDSGFNDPETLQIEWMGQITAEEGTDYNCQSKDYVTTTDIDLTEYVESASNTGYGTKLLDGSSKKTDYRHHLVFNNSYMISDSNLSKYSYSMSADNVDVSLEHELTDITDEFPDDLDLPTQAATAFGRILSGYDYQVEYLQQDEEKSADTQYDNEWDTLEGVWVPEYFEARSNQKVSDYVNSVPANDDDETHAPYITTETIQDDAVNRTIDVTVYWNYDESSDSYIPSGTFTWPAYYIWHELTVQVPYRTDEDRMANQGYADSQGGENGTIEYGGFSGAIAGEAVSDAGDYYQYTDDISEAGVGSTSYTRDAEAESSQNYDEDGNPCDCHGDDTVLYTKGWYTDFSKPIMKVMTETRNVTGWIEYWQHNTTTALKVYVFGLGPYNKAFYEDQMDDCWWDNSKNQSQVDQTQRIDKARETWNSVLEDNLSGGKFMSLWDEILEHNPYYRYQNITTSSMAQSDNALHGKWYNRQTYQSIFHMIWNTILEDNPNPEGDPDIDMSLYSLSSSLTSYANNVLFAGREDDNGNDTHALPEVKAMSVANAGDILGCGDEDYDFSPYLTTQLSQSAFTTSYTALLQSDDTNSVYEYARYGHLLSDLGIDEIGEETNLSARNILGTIMSVAYIADAGLVFVWDIALSALKALNPFQIFKYASSIASDFKSGMYDDSSSWIVQWASHNETVYQALKTVGEWYDALENIGMIVLMILFVVLIVSILMIQSRIAKFEQQNPYGGVEERRQMWQKIGRYAMRFVFIVVGIPLLGMIYTEVLNAVDTEMQVAAVPATEMVKATFVDFGGWIDTSRLDPVDGMTLESAGDETGSAGMASDDSIKNVRKTAVALNNATGIMPGVDASHFTSIYANEWNNNAWVTYNVTAEDSVSNQIFSDSSAGSDTAPSYVSQWSDDFATLSTAFNFIQSWSNESFYYASDFNSLTMTQFSGQNSDLVGRQKNIDEDIEETGWNNDNTLHQLFENCVGLDNWMNRSQNENEEILTNDGSYAKKASDNDEESHDWHQFNVMANGSLTAKINGSSSAKAKATSTINYSGDTEQGDYSGNGITRIGTDITQKTGLSTLSMYNYLMTDFGDNMLTVYSPVTSAAGNIQKMHYTTTLVGNGALQWVFFASCFAFMFVAAVIGIGYALGMMWSILKHSFSMIGNIPFAMIGVVRSIVQVVLLVVGMILEVLVTMVIYEIMCDLMMMLLTLLESPVMDGIISAFGNSMATSATALTTGGILGSVIQILPECMADSLAGFTVYLMGSVIIVTIIAVWLIKKWPKFMPVIDKLIEWSLLYVFINKEIRKDVLQNVDAKENEKTNKELSAEDCLYPVQVSANI